MYRPPLAWREMLRFLAGRATAGVECVSNESYTRTIAIGDARGWLRVEPIPGRNALGVELSTALTPKLPAVLVRLRHFFDLSSRPDVIDGQLAGDKRLAECIRRIPGLRVLGGAGRGFELAVRAILGQRISVAAATTLAGRVASAFGEPVDTPLSCLNRLAPTPERLAVVELAELTRLGITAARSANSDSSTLPAACCGRSLWNLAAPIPKCCGDATTPRFAGHRATGRPTTSPCVPCAGPTPFRPAIWDCSGAGGQKLRQPYGKLTESWRHTGGTYAAMHLTRINNEHDLVSHIFSSPIGNLLLVSGTAMRLTGLYMSSACRRTDSARFGLETR